MTQHRRLVRQTASRGAFSLAGGVSMRPAPTSIPLSLFFPAGTTEQVEHHTKVAKQVCVVCPVRRGCLSFAIATNQQFGVWGGHDEITRRRLRRTWSTATDSRR